MNIFTWGLYKKMPRGVKVRTWHPGWWIPQLVLKFSYQKLKSHRYDCYEETLRTAYKGLKDGEATLKGLRLLLETVDCSFLCEVVEPYGFVPEDGCPIHDCYPFP